MNFNGCLGDGKLIKGDPLFRVVGIWTRARRPSHSWDGKRIDKGRERRRVEDGSLFREEVWTESEAGDAEAARSDEVPTRDQKMFSKEKG